jgi:hypothetical protein
MLRFDFGFILVGYYILHTYLRCCEIAVASFHFLTAPRWGKRGPSAETGVQSIFAFFAPHFRSFERLNMDGIFSLRIARNWWLCLRKGSLRKGFTTALS